MRIPILTLLFATISAVVFHTIAGTTAGGSSNRSISTQEVISSPPCREDPVDCRQKIIDFWELEKMEAAWPPGQPDFLDHFPIDPVLDPNADTSGYTLVSAPYTAHPLSRITGILFFHLASEGPDSGLHHCSASVIQSSSQNLILTAAHCVYDLQAHQWNDMLMFVPAFDGTQSVPREKWPIRLAFIPRENAPGSPAADIAVARVYSLPSGHTLETEVGGALRPRETGTERFPMVRDIGYPSKANLGDGPYLYAQQRECDSDTREGEVFSNLVLLNCAPQQGNSGGPIIVTYTHPIEVVAVFAKTDPREGQPRLLHATFGLIYKIADSLPP
jgi:hypothetical protein